MRYLWLLICVPLFVACSGNEGSEQTYLKKIEQLEKDLSETPVQEESKVEALRDSLVNNLLAFYRTYPDDKQAPECLDKVHFLYSARMDYATASKYADTLINKYPNYVNRLMVIESQYNTFDMFIKPRNKDKAKYYLELLLKEDKEMDEQRRADFEYRLEFIDLSMEQLIEQEMTELN